MSFALLLARPAPRITSASSFTGIKAVCSQVGIAARIRVNAGNELESEVCWLRMQGRLRDRFERRFLDATFWLEGEFVGTGVSTSYLPTATRFFLREALNFAKGASALNGRQRGSPITISFHFISGVAA